MRYLFSVLALTLAFSLPTEVFAQPAQQADGVEITSKDRENFAKVQPKIVKLNQELRTQLQGAEEATEARKIQGKFQEKMVKAVTSSGLSVEKYNAIASQQSPGQ